MTGQSIQIEYQIPQVCIINAKIREKLLSQRERLRRLVDMTKNFNALEEIERENIPEEVLIARKKIISLVKYRVEGQMQLADSIRPIPTDKTIKKKLIFLENYVYGYY